MVACAGLASAAPVETPWPADGPDDTVCTAAAVFAGWYAAGDSFEDRVEIRDVRGQLRRAITREEITALLPWMSLGGGPDGPSALAWTASGRVLYILVHDAAVPGDGLGSDAVLKYDVPGDSLSLFARLDAFDRDDQWPHLAMVHHRGRLYVGTVGAGVRVYGASANVGSGSLLTTIPLPAGQGVRGLAVSHDLTRLWIASESAVWTGSLAAFPTVPLTQMAAAGDIRAIAWADHYGSPSHAGLYVLHGASQVGRLSIAQATGATISSLTPYTSGASAWHDLAFTADGRLLIGADEDAITLSDNTDTRLSYDAFLEDELQQVVAFGAGLVSPDGEPAGWVIDGDVPPGGTRFHPATPDAAAWTILLSLVDDHLTDDPSALPRVRAILTRHAGLASDAVRPLRSADGLYKHWIDPFTGTTEAGWPDEFATLSTMKIVAAAARAMRFYPDDPQVALAASRIIFRVRNWDAYLQAGTDALAFKGLTAGGPDGSSWARPFHEGIIFVEQAGAYGGVAADSSMVRWFNRALWPSATYLSGRPVTSTANGLFEASFISLYPALLSEPFRASPAWRMQVENLRWSHAAWTDDNAPLYYTVFSAGTNPSGYNADSITNHPFDISTFPSLMALSAFGEEAEAVGAYAAYRKGARQTWKTGASLLYRRSSAPGSAGYSPNSAGLPDVALGALGLAEIIKPGTIDAVLAAPYPAVEMCPIDLNASGAIDVEDLYARGNATPTDLNGDNQVNAADWACLVAWIRRHEATGTSQR